MNDSISRQEAMTDLDQAIARYEQFANFCEHHGMTASKEKSEQFAAWLRELQKRRKAPEIIRCSECAHFRLDSLQTVQLEPQWIPIAKRLPKDGTWNIFTDGKNISVERYKADAIDHFFPPGRWFDLDDAVAWIPLPAPYAEVVGDDES